MKKFYSLLLLFAVIATYAGMAQDNASVTVTVRLHPIQSITVLPSQKNVILDYSTTEQYNDGVYSLEKDHLQIFSTGAFYVTVESSDNQIARKLGTETIESSTLQVTALDGNTNSLADVTLGSVSVTTAPVTLINSGVGSAHKNFNVEYRGIGADGYVGKYFNDEQPTDYETTILYTIFAQ